MRRKVGNRWRPSTRKQGHQEYEEERGKQRIPPQPGGPAGQPEGPMGQPTVHRASTTTSAGANSSATSPATFNRGGAAITRSCTPPTPTTCSLDSPCLVFFCFVLVLWLVFGGFFLALF